MSFYIATNDNHVYLPITGSDDESEGNEEVRKRRQKTAKGKAPAESGGNSLSRGLTLRFLRLSVMTIALTTNDNLIMFIHNLLL